jgi:nucleobase:cation symporter-1, NCS1 family
VTEFVTLAAPLPNCALVNEDISPTPVEARTWSKWHIASLWVAMSVCIPTYMLSAAMIDAGMTWAQALLAIFIGNAIVLVPLVINAHAGTRYGIPFPVYARAAYGTVGAHVPSLLRSVVACGWFGIQTWIGGLAVNAAIGMVWSAWAGLGGDWAFMGYGLPQYISFMLFWFLNLYFVWAGTESIKWLETLAAPFLIAMGLALFGWALTRVGGVGAMLEGSSQLSAGNAEIPFGRFLLVLFVPWVTAMVGYWATLSLNIPDFTRFARSQNDQMVGQAMGLLTAMPLFSFIGVAVTSATVLIYGEAIWNPVDLVARLAAENGSIVIGLIAMGAIIVATLSTNIAANIVSPAISFSNVAPQRISFRVGGLIAGAIGILIFPWRLLDLYQTWLITYSGLLGAVGGVIVCDYVLIRKGVLDLAGLYEEDGPYGYGNGRYGNGINPAAMIATAGGIGVALLGLLHPSLAFLFNGAWFSAALSAMLIYWFMMKNTEIQ